MDSPPIWTGSRYMDLRLTNTEATWHPHGLSKPYRILNGNILRFTINPSQWNPNMGRISQNTHVYEDIPHKEISS